MHGKATSEDRLCTSAVPSKPEIGCTEGVCDSSLESRDNQCMVIEWEGCFKTALAGNSPHGHGLVGHQLKQSVPRFVCMADEYLAVALCPTPLWPAFSTKIPMLRLLMF